MAKRLHESEVCSFDHLPRVLSHPLRVHQDLLYWEVERNGRQVRNVSLLRDVRWHTSSCTIGWSLGGFYPEVGYVAVHDLPYGKLASCFDQRIDMQCKRA